MNTKSQYEIRSLSVLSVHLEHVLSLQAKNSFGNVLEHILYLQHVF